MIQCRFKSVSDLGDLFWELGNYVLLPKRSGFETFNVLFWAVLDKSEIDRYQEIIETLRYEKPIYLHVSWDVNNVIIYGMLYANQEPVGEQEGQGAPFTP